MAEPAKVVAIIAASPALSSLLAMVVEIESVFYHCAKAFLRSALWDPETWRPDAAPSRPQIAHRQERPDEPLEELERYYGAQYPRGLYPTGN